MSSDFFDQHGTAREVGGMLDLLMTIYIAVAAIGAGLMAGVYFAFSGLSCILWINWARQKQKRR